MLDAAGVKLFLVSIGTKERGLEFVEKTGFPAERLLADPEGSVYEALRLKKGLKETFLSVEVRIEIIIFWVSSWGFCFRWGFGGGMSGHTLYK